VAGLIKRGLRQLRQALQDSGDTPRRGPLPAGHEATPDPKDRGP
jgi:hypothetical protein